MKYLRIRNNGLMEYQALTLVGASTKRNDETKIGQFGSGNKYALAYFLRNHYEVTIFAGLSEIAITTQREIFRGIDYDVIYVNGEKTSITTEMGMNWTLWQAIREIYCNAIDEGGHCIELVNEIEPEEGVTNYYIKTTPEIFDFLQHFDEYFAVNKKVLFECKTGRILEKTGKTANIYRRGVKCYETDSNSIFDYDFNDIEIDENRLVIYSWHVTQKIWDIVFRCDKQELILNVLHNAVMDNNIENKLDDYVSYPSDSVMSECFKYTVTNNNLVPQNQSGLLKPEEVHTFIIIPSSIYKSIRGYLKDCNIGEKFRTSNLGAYRFEEPDAIQNEVLNEAIEKLKSMGYHISFPVKVVVTNRSSVFGIAGDNEIYITKACLDEGINATMIALIEENIHIKYQVNDFTRGMQTALITELVNYMKKINVEVV